MEPGRELDALVAEKVMGWSDIQHGPGCDCCTDTWTEWTGLPPLEKGDDGKRFIPHPRCGQCGCQPDRWRETRITADARRTVPGFSTAMAVVWGAIERVYELTGKWVLIAPFRTGFIAYEKTGCGDEDYGDFCEFGTTPAHAASLAVLTATAQHEARVAEANA